MELLGQSNEDEVAKCWILHEKKIRKDNIGARAIAAISKGNYKVALFSYRKGYADSIFSEIKEWKKVKLNLNDIEHLEHVHCEFDNLSKGSMKIKEIAKNIINNPNLADEGKNPESWWHVRDILERLEELAKDETPVIIGKDHRSKNIRIYDGLHRLIATLIYWKIRKSKKFKEKDAYYGHMP
jgi:ABC-type Mn2+/Zn2+ transport system ATPase subunit